MSENIIPINGRDAGHPDHWTPERRAEWAKAHGLPPDFLLVTVREMAAIRELRDTARKAVGECGKWRAAAKILFNDRDPQGLVQSCEKLKAEFARRSAERDRYRITLAGIARSGNPDAKAALEDPK